MILTLLVYFITLGQPSNILIGDSQTRGIATNSKLATLDATLQKGGWRVSDLMMALKVHTVNQQAKNVFICIGTNGVFSPADDVKGLNTLLRTKFPNAKLYVIYGSFGWYQSQYATKDRIETYYMRFEACGIHKLKTGIGYSKEHPCHQTKSIIDIGKEIDTILSE